MSDSVEQILQLSWVEIWYTVQKSIFIGKEEMILIQLYTQEQNLHSKLFSLVLLIQPNIFLIMWQCHKIFSEGSNCIFFCYLSKDILVNNSLLNISRIQDSCVAWRKWQLK